MTKYIAKFEGQIVGKRTTKGRTYTHAVVVQNIEDVARDRAFNRSAAEIKQDRENFAYYVREITTKVVVDQINYGGGGDWKNQIERREFDKYTAIAAAGVDAYIEDNRQRAIRRFEDQVANGGFLPFVAGWAGRLDLAQKAVAQHTGAHCKLVAIVEAELA